MRMRSEDVDLILDVVRKHANRLLTSKSLDRVLDAKISYLCNGNPQIHIGVTTPLVVGNIGVWFGSGTADISVWKTSDGDSLYEWHNTITELPQFLDVLQEAFAFFLDIYEDHEEPK